MRPTKEVKKEINREKTLALYMSLRLNKFLSKGLGVNVLSQEQFNKTVDEIVTMGFSRQEAIVALQAAYNNPDRAIDYLLNVYRRK